MGCVCTKEKNNRNELGSDFIPSLIFKSEKNAMEMNTINCAALLSKDAKIRHLKSLSI